MTGKNITTAVVDTGEYIVVMTVFAKFRSFIYNIFQVFTTTTQT